jgi:hypothetical protein
VECVWRRYTDGFDVYVGDLQCADACHCQPNGDSDGDFRGRRHEIGVRQRNSDASSNGHNDLASDGRYGWRGVLSPSASERRSRSRDVELGFGHPPQWLEPQLYRRDLRYADRGLR